MHRLLERSRIRHSLTVALLLFAGCLVLGSCDSTPSPTQPKSADSGEMSVAIRLSKRAAADISRAEVVITGTGMAEMRQNLVISGNSITGIVRGISAGANRLFTLNGYDSSGSLTYTGSAGATVVAGQQVTVSVTVRSTVSVGKPTLVMGSSVSAQREPWGSSNYKTTITGEISNNGAADATDVVISFRARNLGGAAIGDASTSIGIIQKGQNKLFSAVFSETDYFRSDSRYVVTIDFTISYNEGSDVIGSLTMR